MPKRVSKKQKNPQMSAAIYSVVLTIALLLTFSAIGGILMLKGVLPEGAIKPIAAVAVFMAALLGPMPIMKIIGKRQLPIAYASMVALLLALVICKLIFWPAAPFGNWMVLVAAPVGATLAGFLQARRPKRKH